MFCKRIVTSALSLSSKKIGVWGFSKGIIVGKTLVRPDLCRAFTVVKVKDELPEDPAVVKKGADGIYNGDLKDGLKHGYGVFKHTQYMYEGNWVNNFRDGLGKLTYLDGRIYEGLYKEGKKHGKGKLIYADGSIYDGEWNMGSREGSGVYTNVDGSTWVGEFKNNEFYNGSGTVIVGLERHEGTWVNGTLNGKCIRKYSDGGIYVGHIEKWRRHGRGIFTYNGKGVYDGEWQNNLKHGHGRYDYSNNEFYEGEWKDDRRHGKGKFSGLNGFLYEGHFEDGVMHGKGHKTFANGVVYHGDFVKNKRQGMGREIMAVGHIYEGEWHGDSKHGSGVVTYIDGSRFEGTFFNGMRHGNGKVIDKNGNSFTSTWEAGKRTQPFVPVGVNSENMKPEFSTQGDLSVINDNKIVKPAKQTTKKVGYKGKETPEMANAAFVKGWNSGSSSKKNDTTTGSGKKVKTEKS